MSILPHTVVGSVAGSVMPNPILAFLVGVFTHFVLDVIPHYDPEIRDWNSNTPQQKLRVKIIIALDILTSVILLGLLLSWPVAFWGGIGGAIVDADNFAQFKWKFFPLLSKLGITAHEEGSRWHKKLKYSEKVNFMIGFVMQSVICLVGLYILYQKNLSI